MRFVRILLVGAVLLGFSATFQPAEAQILKRLKNRAAAKVEEKLGEKQDEAIDKAFDGDSGEEAEVSSNQPASSAGARTEAEATEPTTAPAADVAKLKPGEGAWANYDFVPGERPIFIDDFSNDRIGNFPQRMEFKSGNMQIVEWEGQRWLSAEGGELYINLPEVLPDRFTMEFDLVGSGNAMSIEFGPDAPDYEVTLEVGTYFARLRNRHKDIDAQGDLRVDTNTEPVTIRVSVDGQYVKLYANEPVRSTCPTATSREATGST